MEELQDIILKKPWLKDAEFIELSPVEQLRYIPVETSDGVYYRYTSDVALLLNSERIINALGEEGYRALVRSITNPRQSNYANGKYTDDQLMEQVKSRHLQAPSELRAWTQYLAAEAGALDEERQRILKEETEKKLAELAAKQDVKPNPE